MAASKTFRVVLIKPSRYDNDGYVVQWVRSIIPSNTLATLYGLALDCANRKVLGEGVEILIDAYDEPNTVIPIQKIIQDIQQADAGIVGLVGVQTNQFPRSVDIAHPFREAGIPVVIGGFHVSGCLAMLPEMQIDIQKAMDMGITIYAGEAEGRLDVVFRDVWEGKLKPLYNYLDDLPELTGAVIPFLPKEHIEKTIEGLGSLDAGRGCPFQCSFCTIINVQGRKSRWRTPDDVEKVVRANLAQGVNRFFITDDDFARNKNWEAIFDRLIHLREVEGLDIKFIIQVDALCHRLPNFIEKAARAGCRRVFIGLENINPENLVAAKKRQNKIWEYRQMLQAWKDHGCMTYAGYIIGFPGDTPQSIARDIDIIKKELPVDLLEFFCLTPLPGSEDHKKLQEQGVRMETDMNRYTLEYVTTDHPKMLEAEWYEAYNHAWKQYYTLEHVETLMRRAAARHLSIGNMMLLILWFYGGIVVNNLHPLENGYLRRKVRTQRRPSFPIENPLVFYPKRLWEILRDHARFVKLVVQYARIRRKVKADPNRKNYTDLSLTPVTIEEEEDLDLIKVFHPRQAKTASVHAEIAGVK